MITTHIPQHASIHTSLHATEMVDVKLLFLVESVLIGIYLTNFKLRLLKRIWEDLLRSSHILSFGFLGPDSHLLVQILYIILFYFIVVHIMIELLFRLLVILFRHSMRNTALPWHTEDVTIVAFGDTKVGKTSLLEKLNPSPDDVVWTSDICAEGSTAYRSCKTGYTWHGGRLMLKIIRR